MMFPAHVYHRNLLKKSLLCNDTSVLSYLTFKSSFSNSTVNLLPIQVEENDSKVFFSQPAQSLMRKLTGLDLDKINKFRTSGRLQAPIYKFMTTEMLEMAQKEAIRNSLKRLQMPPLLPANKAEPEILDNTPEVIGFCMEKIVFTDITYNVSDRKRLVVVREPNGILRRANAFEKHRMNQLYFPKPGREYRHPRMFKRENLEPLWEKGEYEFILDRACCQFEPDDPEFHEVTFETYERINNSNAFDVLRSTRHYGTFVFYLCLSKNLNNLLKENLETNRLEDAISLIQLYTLIHPECKFKSFELDTEDKLKFIQSFVDTEMKNAEPLKILLENLTIQAEKDREQAKKESEQQPADE